MLHEGGICRKARQNHDELQQRGEDASITIQKLRAECERISSGAGLDAAEEPAASALQQQLLEQLDVLLDETREEIVVRVKLSARDGLDLSVLVRDGEQDDGDGEDLYPAPDMASSTVVALAACPAAACPAATAATAASAPADALVAASAAASPSPVAAVAPAAVAPEAIPGAPPARLHCRHRWEVALQESFWPAMGS